jgi:hypothetical protein
MFLIKCYFKLKESYILLFVIDQLLYTYLKITGVYDTIYTRCYFDNNDQLKFN